MTLSRQPDSCVSVRSVFEVERRLSAPLYQRRFSWDKRNLDEFWDDVRLGCVDNCIKLGACQHLN